MEARCLFAFVADRTARKTTRRVLLAIGVPMDAFSAFFDSQTTSTNRWSSLKNFDQISTAVQSHLKQVYLSLFCALIASAAGAYLHVLWNIGGLLTTFACIGSIVWLLNTPAHEEKKRVSLLMATGLFQGASIGPLIDLAAEIDPSIIVSAFVGTAVAFGCFSLAAMLARRREFLYLGGYLAAGLSILLWLQFATMIFGGSVAIFKFELYFGLLVFVGYMIVDTQDIIEKAHLGDRDYVKHALLLFTDFVEVFIRILIIMLKNSAEKRDKKKRRKN